MRASFLDAICAEPDDLTHRLVYADWLEEHGRQAVDLAQAELIRVQIALESANADEEEYWALRSRERWLIANWGTGLPGSVRSCFRSYRFRRGFIEWGEIDAGMLETFGERILSQTPLRGARIVGAMSRYVPGVTRRLREVDLSAAYNHGIGGTLPEVFDLERLTALTVGPSWYDEIDPILRAGLPALEHLGVEHGSYPMLIPLIEDLLPRACPRLRSLTLRLLWFDNGGDLARLVGAPILGNLQRLHLCASQERSTIPILSMLSRSPASAGLRTLHLEHFRVVGSRQEDRYLGGLQELHLKHADIIWPTQAAWLGRLYLGELRHLRIEQTEIPDTALDTLFHFPRWAKLHTLEMVTSPRPHVRTYETLIEGPHLPRLRRLELGFMDAGSLRRLALGRRPLSGGEEQVLNRGPGLLSELEIHQVGPGTRMEPLFQSPYLGQLRHLELGEIESAGMQPIPPGCLPRLETLDIRGEAILPGVKQALRNRLGGGLKCGPTQKRNRPTPPEPSDEIPF